MLNVALRLIVIVLAIFVFLSAIVWAVLMTVQHWLIIKPIWDQRTEGKLKLEYDRRHSRQHTAKRLGWIYHMRATRSIGPAVIHNSEVALEWYRKSFLLTKRRSIERQALLLPLARVAFTTNLNDDSGVYANEALDGAQLMEGSSRDAGIHFAHTILGRIAIRAGDIPSAKEHLIASAGITRCMPWSMIGPSMALADELVKQGETDSVLEYLRLCRRIWILGLGRLWVWRRQLAAGRSPHFGRNARLW